MIRTKTTLVVGAGASCELQFPDGKDLLARIAAGFDSQRLGGGLESPDIVAMAAHIEAIAKQARVKKQLLQEAGQIIRSASRISSSIDAILEQHGDNPLVLAVGKLAIAHYTLDAEAKCPMGPEPRDPGDLPVRGTENWLFQLSHAIVNGVPRAKADQCFDNLSIINFNYDRTVEHYLPWALHMAFGMSLTEARALVAEKLRIIHAYGTPGRLDWQTGDRAVAAWGETSPDDLAAVVEQIRTASERGAERGFKRQLLGEVVHGKRLVFLGFGFEPMNCAMLFDAPFEQNADVLITMHGASETERSAVLRLLKRQAGIKDESTVMIENLRAWQLMRDYAPFLES
ncbi:hypothetical protein CP97_09010 [Aurantiacibacter atlanticus]|uniref:SIR2-like domain-containing protein n=1 Tax=Aurantiacibacter atlanticus TaxID=1648404 RepID=A0A0H4VBU7_9SPHN|nr:hypothetical protein [Aurantiacibacter atlanticus]AKQ42127.1 hypothetical protein CP97_09010 [Aurantiacibacter atlanticus]MDF1834188.1 hypothetical protein [Alteraurantiacibacter sp. bin_em_oilr2.035]